MKVKGKPLLALALFVAVVAASFIAMLAIPPWESRIPFLVQYKIGEWTGIYFHHVPSNFTGILRFWDEEGNLREEEELKNGRPNGTWISYDSAGKKTITEYRNGQPWDGICYLRYMKSWTAEYRKGKPWNGCIPVYHNQTGEYTYQYFINGVETSESDYKTYHHIPANAQCYGLQYFIVDQKS
ncbi:MAG: hypothetical protein ABSH19_01360 [Opitutales bacterium]|jgi:hypothetical protein